MISRMIVITLLAGIVALVPVAASAYEGVVLNLQPVSDGGSVQTVQLGYYTDDGTGNPSTNDYDGCDMESSPFAMPGMIQMDIVNPVIGFGLAQSDFRAPNGNPGDPAQIWRLSTCIPMSFGMGAQFSLDMSFSDGFTPSGQSPAFYILDGDFSTEAECLAAIDTNLICMLSGDVTSFAGGNFSIPDPEFDCETGMFTTPSYNFTVYSCSPAGAAAVPEPGSLLALFSGMVGLVGYGVRRRR